MRRLIGLAVFALLLFFLLSHLSPVFSERVQQAWQVALGKSGGGVQTMESYRQMAYDDAQEEDIPPTLFVRQIEVESGFNPREVGQMGEIGLCQFLPSTAQAMGIDPTDPQECLQAAARMDGRVYRQTGNFAMALASYNCGGGCLTGARQYGRWWGCHIPWITQHYIREIMGSVVC